MEITLQNWKTTLGGILIGLASLIPLTPLAASYPWLAAFINGAGGLLLGLSAKDFNTHSTNAEVQKSTVAKKQKLKIGV